MNWRQVLGTWSGVASAVALTSMLLMQFDAVRLPAAVVFCLLAPGYGWARRMRSSDGGDVLALAIVFSLCATIAVGTVMAVSGYWSPVAGFSILVAISIAGLMPFRRNKATHRQGTSTKETVSRGPDNTPNQRFDSLSRVPDGRSQ